MQVVKPRSLQATNIPKDNVKCIKGLQLISQLLQTAGCQQTNSLLSLTNPRVSINQYIMGMHPLAMYELESYWECILIIHNNT